MKMKMRAFTLAVLLAAARYVVAQEIQGNIVKDSASQFEIFSKYSSAAYCPELHDGTATTQVCQNNGEGRCDELEDATTMIELQPGFFTVAGYVAFVKGNGPAPPHIVVAFKGTGTVDNKLKTVQEWTTNKLGFPTLRNDICEGCQVHLGFASAFDKVKDNVLNAILPQMQIPGQEDIRIVVTGHSLGGAVATITAAWLRKRNIPCDLYTYGAPRVGNAAFTQFISDKTLGFTARITNKLDVVTTVAPTVGSFLPYQQNFPEYWYQNGTIGSTLFDEGLRKECSVGDNQCGASTCSFIPFTTGLCSATDHSIDAYTNNFSACVRPNLRRRDSLDVVPTIEDFQEALDILKKEAEDAGVALPTETTG